jgi:hypothetical protein
MVLTEEGNEMQRGRVSSRAVEALNEANVEYVTNGLGQQRAVRGLRE